MMERNKSKLVLLAEIAACERALLCTTSAKGVTDLLIKIKEKRKELNEIESGGALDGD